METTDSFERQLRGKGRRAPIALGLIGAAAAGTFVYFIARDRAQASAARDRNAAAARGREAERRAGAETPEEKAAVTAQLDAAVARVAEENARYRTHVAAAIAQATDPAAGGTTCPVDRDRVGLVQLAPGDAVGDSLLARNLADYVTRAKAELARGFNPFTTLGEPTGERYEVVFATRRRVEPNRVGNLFVPGELEGRALLWDHAAGAVVCAADLRVENSDSVRAGHRDSGVGDTLELMDLEAGKAIEPGAPDPALVADLDDNLVRAIWVAPAMRTVEAAGAVGQ
jgi:hypothetical protein